MSDLSISSYSSLKKTDKGTQIVNSGDDMNKNAFLTILAAELANMDPTANVDSTQYVTQLAQFASMEQMTNLNSTMTQNAYTNLVGKGATVKVLDSDGNPYTGIIRSVNSQNGSGIISLEVLENGSSKYLDFDTSDIVSVVDVPDYSLPPLNNINGSISMLLASSYIGKNVELSEKDTNNINITGTVIGISKSNGEVFVKIKLSNTEEIKEVSYDKVLKVFEKD